jgi:hypothetical protein
MNPSVWDLAPAIVGVIAGAVGLISVWLSVRQAHRGSGKARRRRPDPTAAE